MNKSLLQVKLNDLFDGLNIEEIASKFHLDREDAMATLVWAWERRLVGIVSSGGEALCVENCRLAGP